MKLVELENISFSYDGGETLVLDGVSLSLEEKEHVALVGRNGCGKSTLGKIVAGLLAPDSGKVQLMGLNCFDDSCELVTTEKAGVSACVSPENYEAARRKIAYVAQDPSTQLVCETVAGELAFGAQNLCLGVERIDELVALELEKAGLGAIAERDPMTLSGGEQQLVTIAAAVATEPELVVLDEPTAYLDAHNSVNCMRLIEKLVETCCVFHITHKPEEIARSSRVVNL